MEQGAQFNTVQPDTPPETNLYNEKHVTPNGYEVYTTTASKGDEAAAVTVDHPSRIESANWGHLPLPISAKNLPNGASYGAEYKPNNPSYEPFPAEEGGQGVLFHRARPEISLWGATENAGTLSAAALAGAINHTVKNSGMLPSRDTTLSKFSGKAVAKALDKPEIEANATFGKGEEETLKNRFSNMARHSASIAKASLSAQDGNHISKNYTKKATPEELAKTTQTMREIGPLKKAYKAMEEGQQWDPNTLSVFRDRAKKEEKPAPEPTKPSNYTQLELG